MPLGSGPGRTLIVRFVQISDAQVVDSLSPARWAGAHEVVSSAWRPYEAYSGQLLDGIVRVTNRIHASGTPVDFVLCTGDVCDNAQSNELHWFLDIMDGRSVNPLSGPDDRDAAARPPTLLDPYAGFQPQGLYQQGVHGDLASVPWYALIGNHDVYAIGVFPIVDLEDGRRVSPLPLSCRPGLLLPNVFDPVGSLAWGNVTPAEPGPPRLLEPPSYVSPNPDRRYINRAEIMEALAATGTDPPGHGLAGAGAPGWYSLSPVPGLRLIALDTAEGIDLVTGRPSSEGAISEEQVNFLRDEIDAAQARGEWVIVATHHPSETLALLQRTEITARGFRDLLNSRRNVLLHICGHRHFNRVAQRGGYVELETCSTLDWPQQARLVEIWREEPEPSDGDEQVADAPKASIVIAYRTFSHLDDSYPPLGPDPLRPLREQAYTMAGGSLPLSTAQKQFVASEGPAGEVSDRQGEIRLTR